MASILMAILLGWRGAILSIAVNIAALTFIGILLHRGFWADLTVLDDPLVYWERVAIDIFFINLFTTISATYLFKQIQGAVWSARCSAALLNDERAKLIEANQALETEIVQRREAEATIKKNLDRERHLLDSIAAGIAVVDRNDKTVVYINATALSMHEAAEENMIGQVCSHLICPDEDTGCPITDLGQERDCSERELRKVNGDRVPILKTVVPIEFNGKDCLLETFIDISDRKQLEGNLAQAQKMQSLGTLAGGIAHDFNNILAAIQANTELALMIPEKETTLAVHLMEIQQACLRAGGMVRQILAFARQSDLKREPVRVAQVAEEVLRLLRSTIPTTIQIKSDIDSRLHVTGDSTQIHQIFMNLGTNAAQAMENHGGILEVLLADTVVDDVAARDHIGLKPGDHVRITVSDTGIGIPEDHLETVFDPYFTTKPMGEGTGLGLSVVHGIVKSLGGEITVESRQGQGTQFTIHLPAGRPPHAHAPRGLSELPRGSGRILVVDDEPAVAKVMGRVLKKFGYAVTIHTDSLAALDDFNNRPQDIDAVITDMTMPNLAGDQLAARVKSIRPDTPVLLCTGFNKKIETRKAAEVGVDALLMKPVPSDILIETLQQVLEEKRETIASQKPSATANA